MDEVVELPRPGLDERARLIRQYFSTYLHHTLPANFLPAPVVAKANPRQTVNNTRGQQQQQHNSSNCSDSNDFDSDNQGHHGDDRDVTKPGFFVPTGAGGAQPPHVPQPANATTRSAVVVGTSPQQPGLDGETERGVFPLRKYGNGNHGMGGRGGGGVVRMGESFREKAPGLMAMLAVRSEGFYGRDMAHFFSAVQVRACC